MADLAFTCPDCGAKLKIDATAAGYLVPCPKCRVRLKIPAVSGQPAISARHPAPVLPGSTMYKVLCPECQGTLRMERDHAGRGTMCPHCQKFITLPLIMSPSAPLAPPRPPPPGPLLSPDEIALLSEPPPKPADPA